MQVLAPRTGLSLARVSNHVFCPSNDRVVFVVAGSNPVASTILMMFFINHIFTIIFYRDKRLFVVKNDYKNGFFDNLF